MIGLFLGTLLVAAPPAKLDFDYPIFVSVGADGAVYVSDQNIPAIYKIAADGRATTLYKGQKFYRTPLYRARASTLDPQGNLLVCDPATFDVYSVSPRGVASPLTGKNVKLLNGKETTLGELLIPEGVAVAADGTVFVSDLKYRAIFKIGADRKPAKWAEVPAPRGLTLDSDGSLVVVSHGEAQLLRVNTKDGSVSKIVEGRPFGFPLSVAARDDGYLVADNYAKALWLVSRAGKVEKYLDGIFGKCTGVAVDKEGNAIVADPEARKIFRITRQKEVSTLAEGLPLPPDKNPPEKKNAGNTVGKSDEKNAVPSPKGEK